MNLHLVLSVNSHYSSSRVIKSTNAPTLYVSLIEIIPDYLGIYIMLLIIKMAWFPRCGWWMKGRGGIKGVVIILTSRNFEFLKYGIEIIILSFSSQGML